MGGLYYPNTIKFDIAGSRLTDSPFTITEVALTNAYQAEDTDVPTKSFDASGYSKLNLNVSYTTGSGETNNSIEIKVENSDDGTNWFQIPNESTSAGTSTITQREFTFVGAAAATTYVFSIGIDIFYPWIRVSAKESGVVTNAGTCYIGGTLLGL